MPTNKKQLLRMVKMVADLRKNSYPNANTWVKKFEALDRDENLNIACGKRTVMRDIDYLRKDFNAPIAYSSEHNGYYLTNPYWEFQVPFFDDEMIFACESWMLSDRLELVFNSDSNVLKFRNDYHLLEQRRDENHIKRYLREGSLLLDKVTELEKKGIMIGEGFGLCLKYLEPSLS